MCSSFSLLQYPGRDAVFMWSFVIVVEEGKGRQQNLGWLLELLISKGTHNFYLRLIDQLMLPSDAWYHWAECNLSTGRVLLVTWLSSTSQDGELSTFHRKKQPVCKNNNLPSSRITESAGNPSDHQFHLIQSHLCLRSQRPRKGKVIS